MTSWAGRLWKIENTKFTLHPLDENDPAGGGKMEGSCFTFNARTFTFHTKTLYGIYGEDFVQYGTFVTEGDPLNDEEYLLEVTKEDSPHIVSH